MRRRVRWDNVIRVAGAALIVGLVVAWPRLAAPEPEVPAPEAAPLIEDEGGEELPPLRLPEARREPAEVREAPEAADGRERDRRARRRKGSRGHEREAPQGERVVAVRPHSAAPPRRAPTSTPRPNPPPGSPRPAPSPDPDPARTEFGFE
jgi:hypothetical protein